MSEWRETNFGEVIDVINGFAFKSANFLENMITNSLPVIKIKNVANGNVHLNGVQYHAYSENLSKYIVKKDDVLVALTGNHPQAETQVVGLTSRYKLDCTALINQRVAKVISKNEEILSTDYIYYFLKDTNTHLYLASRSSGSANQANISKSDIENIPFSLPPENEQKAIAAVLSSLDDKIDLLHRQNKTLEAMAETLFKQLVVVEAQEDWESVPFGKWIENTFGGEWGKEELEAEFVVPVYCIRGTDIADLQTGLATKTPMRFIKKKKFESIEPKNGDIIIEISGGTENQSTGRALYINEQIKSLYDLPLVFSNFCRLIRPRKPEYSFFIYSYIQYLYNQDEFFNLENGSSGIKNLNYKGLLFELPYVMPPEEKIFEFNNQVSIYFLKINKNKKQIQILETLRDNLLPKFMSGEVRVKY